MKKVEVETVLLLYINGKRRDDAERVGGCIQSYTFNGIRHIQGKQTQRKVEKHREAREESLEKYDIRKTHVD
jgi:hypothetical protein